MFSEPKMFGMGVTLLFGTAPFGMMQL